MPDAHLDHALLSSFETMAPFDEFQNFGVEPEFDEAFLDLEDLEDIED